MHNDASTAPEVGVAAGPEQAGVGGRHEEAWCVKSSIYSIIKYNIYIYIIKYIYMYILSIISIYIWTTRYRPRLRLGLRRAPSRRVSAARSIHGRRYASRPIITPPTYIVYVYIYRAQDYFHIIYI